MARGRIVVAGLMVLLAAAVAVTQPPREGGGFGRRMFGPGPAVMLLGAPEVRKELATTQSQNDQIDKLIADFLEESRPDFSDFENSRKKAEEAGKKADEKLARILEARQLTRLNQLRLQREGLMAFNRPEVVKQLALSEDQQSKLRKLQEEMFGRFGRGPQEIEKALADAVAILTPKQKEKWSELTGKEFKFAQGGPQGGGFGGPRGGGFGGPMGGPMGQVRELVKQFDKDKDGRLNTAERKAAREFLKNERSRGGFGRGRGGFGRGNQTPPRPGPRIKPEDVPVYTKVGLYEPTVLRTFFLEFENKDWEQELADFYHTDVEVPATLIVDGKKYPNVGVRFRGTSSFFAVGEGFKRSLNISMDYADKKQRLYGYKTLNLLNSHDDPSFLTSVLYSQIARQYLPTPRVNLVKVAINGESWGLYANQQQFNSEFVKENFKTTKGARWKVQGSPGGGGGLEYLGDRVEDYKRRYKIKSKDDPKAWKALVTLCKTLNETPADKLEEALKPMLDIDGVLKFLALDVVLINNDGYWVRASDYSIYLDPKGIFHILPHDMNETFMTAMGGPGGFGGPRGGGGRGPRSGGGERPERPPQAGEQPQRGGQPPRGGPQGGGFGGPRGGGFELDPLVALNDPRKPLRSKLLAVPSLRTRYLQYVKQIAEESLDWKKLGPVVAQYRKLIEKEVEADTRKLYPLAAFQTATADTVRGGETPQRGRREMSLRAFADQRRKFLLEHPEVKKLTPEKKTAERK